MERYKVYIGGAEVRNPIGLRQFELRVKRDQDISGLLITATNQFTFFGNGYEILKAAQDANYNDKIKASIHVLGTDGNYTEKFPGVIILSDVKLNLDKRFAKTTIEDASFQGAIQGNKSIKMFLDTSLSKNGEQLTALTATSMDFFQSNGSYPPTQNRELYLYKDALDLLVRFMTDNEVKGVQSIYLDDVNNFAGDSLPYITTGEGVRKTAPTAPNVSFSQLITFLRKTHDLTFDFVINSDGESVMRIEERGFFFNNVNTETIRNIKDLTLEIDIEKLASHMEIGNNTTFASGNCSATTRWFSFQKEDYALRGKGNIDKLIDLTTDFITDSNVIEEIVNNASTAFDDDIIVVLGNAAGTLASKFQSASYCSNTPFYNLPYTNDNIVARVLGALPESVVKFLVGGTAPAKSFGGTARTDIIAVRPSLLPEITIPQASEHFLNFTEVEYDIGSNYVIVPVTFYDIPFLGNFSFESIVGVIFEISEPVTIGKGTTPNITIRVSTAIERWNAAFTVLKERILSPESQIQFGKLFINGTDGADGFIQVDSSFRTGIITHSVTMDCDVSDRIVVKIFYNVIDGIGFTEATASIAPTSRRFKCLGADEDSGVFQVFDPSTFKARLYKFKKNISLSQGDNIRANTRDSLIINERTDQETDKRAWVEEMNQKQETGETQFTLLN